jgi:hypothetical protein
MTEAHLFALGLALAALSGVRAYLTVFAVGLAGLAGWIDLPPQLAVATSPWVLVTAGLLTLVEFTADKIPGVDSGWDLLQTLLRVPVGAWLAGSAMSFDGDFGTTAAVAGGATALLTHLLKAGSRAAINTSPEPVSNWIVSTGEDTLVLGGLALVFAHPWLVLGTVLGFMLAVAFAVAWVLRFVLRRLRGPVPAG